jgi:hypothetical protein
MNLRLPKFPLLLSSLFWASLLPLPAQSSPQRGLWVGEVVLNGVNEVTVPLDDKNVPRAPDPNATTPTFDAANLRLIIHVDALGKASLLKQVAILSKKPGSPTSDNDVALVTDPKLYGFFPPQPASRISSVAFDYGDAKANSAVYEVISRASAAARDAAAPSSASVASVQAAAKLAAQPVVAEADAEAAFNAFLQNDLNPTTVISIATGGVTAQMIQKAQALRDGSFYGDVRGIEMLAAIESVLDGLPGTLTPAERQQAALNAASSFVEENSGYERFLVGELFGDMISAASAEASKAALGLPTSEISEFQESQGGAAVTVVSAAHGLVTGDEVAIQGAALGAYNGVHSIVRIDDDTFRLSVPYVTGAAIDGFSASRRVSPTFVTIPGHGFSDGDEIQVMDSLAAYNGRRVVTVIDADRFSINAVYESTPAVRGSVIAQSGIILGFEGTTDGIPPVKVNTTGHRLSTGDQISIISSGNSSYNGLKTITRIDDSSFTIDQAFAQNPAEKFTWELRVPINDINPPDVLATLISSPAHGLGSGDRVTISGSGKAEYNGEFVVTVADVDSFSIPVVFDPATGDPGVKGSWTPPTGPDPGGEPVAVWKNIAGIRAAISQTQKVDEAKNAARSSAASVDTYSDSRAEDAVDTVLEAIIRATATDGSSLLGQVTDNGIKAAREALATAVPHYPAASVVPSSDYTAFVKSTAFSGSVDLAAAAAAKAAIKEKANIISTPESIEGKARSAAIEALSGVFAIAARSMITELPMDGTFGVGGGGLSTELLLPMNHPTNPFRHRRHPDHVNGFEIRRLINLSFSPESAQPVGRSGYGVDRITGNYEEEIFGLHKPLGTLKDIGLKVSGTFSLNRISQIDALNGR